MDSLILTSALFSMTGFARRAGGDGTLTWAWEIKSVNGKSLELRLRLPPGYESLEAPARAAAQAKLGRGNLQINLALDRGEARPQVRVNDTLLAEYVRLARGLEQLGIEPARADGILALRGVLESGEATEGEEARKQREALLLADFNLALEELSETRRGEGERLRQILLGQVEELTGLVEEAGRAAATQPEALRQRLKKAVDELLGQSPALPEERLAQELALLVLKADVREELDRLTGHLTAVRDLLTAGGAVGRKFDFLAQELNREANTLCSKSADMELTRIGLALKGTIDRLREQALNVE